MEYHIDTFSDSEKDLDNVLQIPAVFISVSKGQTAPTQDLAKSFGPKTPLNDIILEILNKGELQVGEKERHAQLDRVHHEVIDIVAGKLVDPRTKRVYTTGMIEKALAELSTQSAQQSQGHGHHDAKNGGAAPNEVVGGGSTTEQATGTPGKGKAREGVPSWTGVVTTRSAKSQALDAMKALIATQLIPVARARMRLRITCPTNIAKQAAKKAAPKAHADGEHDGDEEEKSRGTIKDRILGYVEQIEHQDTSTDEWEVVGFVEPGAFRVLSDFVGGETKGKGRVEVMDMAVVHEGD